MNNIRSDVAWVLQTIASKELREKYAQSVRFSDQSAIDELICSWADDLYHPSAPFFRDQFDETELRIFREFNDTFDLYCDDVTQKDWQKIMEAANLALKQLNWNEKAYLESDYNEGNS